jgi:hypothetical protein
MHVTECDVPSSSALGRDLINAAYFHDSYQVPLAGRGLSITVSSSRCSVIRHSG